MRVRIGCIDGNTYESDNVPESEIQEWLDNNNGRIGTGAFEYLVAKTVDDFVFWYGKMLSGAVDGYEITSISLNMDGNEREFPIDKIVWHEIERD